MMLDLSKPKHAHVDERLRTNITIWLNTVRPDGRPHSVIVWYLWDGESFLIFSQPGKQKLHNIQQNPNVTLAVDDTHQGSDAIVVEGKATLLGSGQIDTTLAAYVEKYGEHIKQIGYSPETMAKSYSEGIRIAPTKFVGL